MADGGAPEYRQKSTLVNYLRMVVLSLGGWHFGYYVTCMNALTKPIVTGVFGYNETNTDESTLNTINGMVNFVYAMGALIGTLATGELSGRFGRRSMLYFGDILALITVIPTVIAHLAPFLISRFLSGIVAGVNISIYSVWLAELLPNKLCGIGGIVGYFFLTLGVLFSFLCQNIWDYQVLVDYWRVFMCYPLAVALIRLCCYPFLFKTDTPKFYYEQANKEAPAKTAKSSQVAPMQTAPQSPEALVLTKKEENGDHPGTTIATEQPGSETTRTLVNQKPEASTGPQESVSANVHDLHHVKGFDKIKMAYSYIYQVDDLDKVAVDNVRFWDKQKEEGTTKVTYAELFTSKYWKQLLSGSFMSFAQQISGINFFVFYSTVIFDSISGNGKIVTLVVGLVNVGGTFISVFTTFKLGRKPNLLIGCVGEAVGWILFLIGLSYLNVGFIYAAVVIYMLFYSIGLGGSQALYISEVLPPAGVGLALGVQWAFIGITGLTFPFLIKAVGPIAMASFFLIFTVFAGFYIWLTAIETKDKSPKVIFEEFNSSFIQVCKSKKIENRLK